MACNMNRYLNTLALQQLLDTGKVIAPSACTSESQTSRTNLVPEPQREFLDIRVHVRNQDTSVKI